MTDPCGRCKGACCRYMIIETSGPELDQEWLEAHNAEQVGDRVFIDMRCNHLILDNDVDHGKCSIYDDRPLSCRYFVVGSQGCREAIVRAGMDPEEILG